MINADPEFPFWPYPLTPFKPRNKIEVRFWEIHVRNPKIYERIDAQCFAMIAQGRRRYAVDAFFNTIRWDDTLAMNGEEFKMNDHYRPYYSRLWLQNNPEHWGFFELRRVKGEYPHRFPPPWHFKDGEGLLF
jgi:hypothetical protein